VPAPRRARRRQRRGARHGEPARLQPNDREQIQAATYRNRAATDIFEPGSSIKPFFVAAGLASGKYDKRSVIDTSPGFFKVGVKIFEDEHNYGAIDIATVLAKSSKRRHGAHRPHAAAAGDLDHAQPSGFRPGHHQRLSGESAGLLPAYSQWRPIGIVTMSHGYGLSVTPLQLAHAYANHRRVRHRPSGVVPARRAAAPGERRSRPQVCRELLGMLESVVAAEGTGKLAAIPGLPRIGQDRHRVESHRRRLLDRSLHGGVRRGGSRERATPGRGGGHRRTERRAAHGRTGRGSRIFQGDRRALRLLAVAPDQPVNAPEELPASPALGATRTAALP